MNCARGVPCLRNQASDRRRTAAKAENPAFQPLGSGQDERRLEPFARAPSSFILGWMMDEHGRCRVTHVEQQRLFLPDVRWCSRFWCKLRGYTGRRAIAHNEGLVLVETRDSRLNTAVHMLFVRCELGIIWLDGQGKVVDLARARPWQWQLVPRAPARYVLECHPDHLDGVTIGDHLRFGIDTAGDQKPVY